LQPTEEDDVNKTELIVKLAKKAQVTQVKAAEAVDAIFNAHKGIIAAELAAGRKVTLPVSWHASVPPARAATRPPARRSRSRPVPIRPSSRGRPSRRRSPSDLDLGASIARVHRHLSVPGKWFSTPDFRRIDKSRKSGVAFWGTRGGARAHRPSASESSKRHCPAYLQDLTPEPHHKLRSDLLYRF